MSILEFCANTEKNMKPILMLSVLIILWCADLGVAYTNTRDGASSGLQDPQIFNRFLQTVFGSNSSPIKPKLPSVKECCFPKSWQSVLYAYTGLQETEIFAKYFVDEPKGQIAAFFTQTTNGTAVDVVQIVKCDASTKSAIVYVIDPKAKTCRTMNLTSVTFDQLQQQCPSPGSAYLGQFNMGGGETALLLRSWQWNVLKTETQNVDRERLVTANTCLPVMEFLRGHIDPNNTPLLQTINFFNVDTPVKDPTVFTPPTYCKTLPERYDDYHYQTGPLYSSILPQA